jgi:hypothetical protein
MFQQTRHLLRLFISLGISFTPLGIFAEAMTLAISPLPPSAIMLRARSPVLCCHGLLVLSGHPALSISTASARPLEARARLESAPARAPEPTAVGLVCHCLPRQRRQGEETEEGWMSRLARGRTRGQWQRRCSQSDL